MLSSTFGVFIFNISNVLIRYIGVSYRKPKHLLTPPQHLLPFSYLIEISLQIFHCHLKTNTIYFKQIWNQEKTENSQKERKERKKEKARRGAGKEETDTDSRISGRRFNSLRYPKNKTSILSVYVCLYKRWVYISQPRSVSARLFMYCLHLIGFINLWTYHFTISCAV